MSKLAAQGIGSKDLWVRTGQQGCQRALPSSDELEKEIQDHEAFGSNVRQR